MLTYYTDDDVYYVGSPRDGLVVIDKQSHAYEYCEYLRGKYGSSTTRDLDGVEYLIISVSAYRARQIKTFVDLEQNFANDIVKGL